MRVLAALTVSPASRTVMAGSSDNFTVTAFDQSRRRMARVKVSLISIRKGGRPVTGAVGITGAGGTVVLSLRFPTAGTFSVFAVSAHVVSRGVLITVSTGSPHLTLGLTAAAPNIITGATDSFTATARDQVTGNPAGGVSVQLAKGGVLVPGATGTTDPMGNVILPLAFLIAGSYSMTAVSVSVVSNAVTVSVTSPTSTAPVTIATTSAVGATKADCNHKLFFAVGVYWLFYVQDANFAYISSTDKVNWTPPTTLMGVPGPAEALDVYYDNPTGLVYFALAAYNLSYAVGQPQPSGTINWTVPFTPVPVPATTGSAYGAQRPTIRPDTVGNIYIAIEAFIGGANDLHLQVLERLAATGNWSPIFDYDTHQSTADWMGILAKFTNGKMCIYYGTVNGGQTGYIRDWSGTAWGPQIDLSGPNRLEPMNGAGLTIGDTLYWGGFDHDNTGYVGFFKHTYVDGRAGSPPFAAVTAYWCRCY